MEGAGGREERREKIDTHTHTQKNPHKKPTQNHILTGFKSIQVGFIKRVISVTRKDIS